MHQPETIGLKFKNLNPRWFAAVVIYFDLKSILQQLARCQKENESTSSIELQQPSGICFVGIEHENPSQIVLQL